MKVLKFGIIGCGLMGREFASAAARWAHLTGMEVRPEIVAVCDTSPALMDYFSQNFSSVTQTTGDYRELLENPEVEAIYCAVPHNLVTPANDPENRWRDAALSNSYLSFHNAAKDNGLDH